MSLQKKAKWILMLIATVTLSSCSHDGEATNGGNKNPDGLGLNAASLVELSSMRDHCLKLTAPSIKKTIKTSSFFSATEIRRMITEKTVQMGKSILKRVGLELKPLKVQFSSSNVCDNSMLTVSLYRQGH